MTNTGGYVFFYLKIPETKHAPPLLPQTFRNEFVPADVRFDFVEPELLPDFNRPLLLPPVVAMPEG